MAENTKPPKIGKNIQTLRKKRGLTLDELARRSGVSKSMLFQIEQDRVNPSVATVWKIARGLNLGFHDILSGETQAESVLEVLKKKDAFVLVSEDGKCDIRSTSIVGFYDHLETYHLRFSPRGELSSTPHFPGTEEFLTVLKGRLKVTSSSRTVELAAGDSLRYPADVTHSLSNLSKTISEAFLIVHHNENAKRLPSRRHGGSP